MDNIGYMESGTVQRIQSLLSEKDRIGIVVGKNPSLDAMGAALSLYLSLRKMGKQVGIASPTEPIVAISSLVGIDKVKQALDGEGGDLIVSFPYREGEIEKVSYTLEGGFLNIVVKASDEGLSFEENDVTFKRSGGLPTLLFVVGTPRLSDLGNLFDPESLKDTTVVNIDNKTDNQGFGDVVLVSAQYSSVSEQVGQLLQSLQVDIDTDIAQNLFSGIAFATNNFQDPKTSYIAFEMAGTLMQKGAQRPRIEARASQGEEKTFVPFAQPQVSDAGTGFSRPQQPRQQSSEAGSGFARPRQQQRFTPRQDQGDQGQRKQKPWEDQGKRDQQFGSKQHMPQVTQPVQKQQPAEERIEKTEEAAPPDWLAPKVYKSSTLS